MFAILLSALAVAADDVEPPQKAPPPRFVLVTLKDDHLVHRAIVPVTVAVKRKVEVDVNGKKEAREVVEYQTRMEWHEQKWEVKKATITTAGGKKLGLDDLKKRLAKPQVVFVSGDGKAVDEAYLKLLDKDAIVVVPEVPKDYKEDKSR